MLKELGRKLAIFFDIRVEIDSKEMEQAISLEEGDVAWAVDVGGKMETWNLKYRNWYELPISNNDYYKFVKYRGEYYRLRRVHSDVIWVVGPAQQIDN